MNEIKDTRGLPPTAYTSVDVEMDEIRVDAIPQFPGRFSLKLDRFGMARLSFCPKQWDVIDAAVRAGIAAHTQAAAS